MKKIAFLLAAAAQIMIFSTVVAESGHHHESESSEGQFEIPFHKDRLSAYVELDLRNAQPVNLAPQEEPTGTVTPYVSHPNGFVHVGKPVLLRDLPRKVKFPTVHPAVTGTYTYGLLFNGTLFEKKSTAQGRAQLQSNVSLPVIITSSLTGISTTTYLTVSLVNAAFIETQFNTSFVYNPPYLP